MVHILVVDDEKDIRELIGEVLEDNSWSVSKSSSSDSCLVELEEKIPDLVILDIWLQGSELDGLGVLEIIRAKYPFLPVIIISGHGTIDIAVKAIKLGAYDYMEKPFTEDKLVILVKRALELSKMTKDLYEYRLRAKIDKERKFITHSNRTKSVASQLEKLSSSQSRILISGRVGSGKRFAAELIHAQSKRKGAPFIEFDPAGLSDDEANKKLFQGGLDKEGKRQFSLIELATNGTLFIRELSEISPFIQNKLMSFIQSQKNDIRIISSTSKNITDEAHTRLFRQDLLYRLNVVQIEWPSLSERIEDLPFLVDEFLKELSILYGKAPKISQEAIMLMQCYNWPGDVRELRNTIEWLLIMSPKEQEEIKVENLPSNFRSSNLEGRPGFDMSKLISMNLKDAREVFETEYLRMQLTRFAGNITTTANNIGMERSALHRKLKLMHITEEK